MVARAIICATVVARTKIVHSSTESPTSSKGAPHDDHRRSHHLDRRHGPLDRRLRRQALRRRDLPRQLRRRHRHARPVRRRAAPHRRGRRRRASRSRTRTSTATSSARTSSTRRNTPKITLRLDASITRDGDDVTIEGDLTIKGTTQRVTATGTWLEIEADMTGNPRIGVDIEHDDRPHRVRAELERPAAQGRLRARQRREAQRPPRARSGPGLIAMRILAISGSPAPGLAQHEAPPGGGGPAAARGRARAARPRGAARHPPLRRGPARRRASRSRSRSLREAVAGADASCSRRPSTTTRSRAR